MLVAAIPSLLVEVELLGRGLQLRLRLRDPPAPLQGRHLAGAFVHLRVLVAGDGVELHAVETLKIRAKAQSCRVELAGGAFVVGLINPTCILMLCPLIDLLEARRLVLVCFWELRSIEWFSHVSIQLLH